MNPILRTFLISMATVVFIFVVPIALIYVDTHCGGREAMRPFLMWLFNK